MSAFKRESLALKYIQDVAKSHQNAAYRAFCVGYSQLEHENAELRKLVQQMKCCTNCNSRLWAATGKGDCQKCKDFDKWTPPQQTGAAERGE